jgi:hypothetical protein
MKLLVRAVAHLLFLFGLLVFIALPGNQYAWMQGLDPTLAALPVDAGSGNRAIFAFLVLVVAAAAQLAIAFKPLNRIERVVSVALALVAISLWWLRWGPLAG